MIGQSRVGGINLFFTGDSSAVQDHLSNVQQVQAKAISFTGQSLPGAVQMMAVTALQFETRSSCSRIMALWLDNLYYFGAKHADWQVKKTSTGHRFTIVFQAQLLPEDLPRVSDGDSTYTLGTW